MYCDKLYIKNRRGRKLATLIFMPSEKPGFQLLAAHGFRGRKENSDRIYGFADKINGLGGALIAFDFAGSGESEGNFAEITLTGQKFDLLDVVDFISGREAGPLVVLGRSFGGTTALAAAYEDERIKGLILWSTPVFLYETFVQPLPEADKKLLGRNKISFTDENGAYEVEPGFFRDLASHDLKEYILQMGKRPILVIHGSQDEVVKPENADFIFMTNPAAVEMHMIPGADHRFALHQEVREDLTVKWLQKHFLGVSFHDF